MFWTGLSNISANLATVTRGIPAFFTPNLAGWMSSHSVLGIEHAAYYTTAPLRETLSDLIDLEHCDEHKIRLTVGAVNASNGEMRYFDSREETLGSITSSHPAPCRRRFLRCASTAIRTGTAASIPTRQSKPCSTTSPARTR